MTPQQQKYRRAAIAGLMFSLASVTAFFLLPVIGLTASYLQAGLEGNPAPLFDRTVGWDAVINGGILFMIAPLPFVLAAIFWGFALEAAAHSRETGFYRIAQWFVSSTFILGLMLGAIYQYIFLYDVGGVRLDALYLMLSIQFIYNIANSGAAFGTLYAGYRAQTLPPRLVRILIPVEIGLVIFQFVALNPDLHAAKIIIFYFVGTIRIVALAVHMGLASLPTLPTDPDALETVISAE